MEVLNSPPETVVGKTAFCKKAVDMWVPFQGSAEGMQDADESGDKIPAFIQFMEHSENDAAHGLKKAVKQGTVMGRSSRSMVKTSCLWVQSMSLKDIAVERSMQYLLPQVGQNLD